MASCPRILQAAVIGSAMNSKHLTYPHPLWYPTSQRPPRAFTVRRVVLHITGMTCGHCMHAVNSALASTPGVRLDSLRMGRAALSYDEQTTDPAAIERVIADAGYTATAAPAGDGAEEAV
jgi:copper chaperone